MPPRRKTSGKSKQPAADNGNGKPDAPDFEQWMTEQTEPEHLVLDGNPAVEAPKTETGQGDGVERQRLDTGEAGAAFMAGLSEISACEQRRTAENEAITSAMNQLAAQGWPKKVTHLIRAITDMDEPTRRQFDYAYHWSRKHAKLPQQLELFDVDGVALDPDQQSSTNTAPGH